MLYLRCVQVWNKRVSKKNFLGAKLDFKFIGLDKKKKKKQRAIVNDAGAVIVHTDFYFIVSNVLRRMDETTLEVYKESSQTGTAQDETAKHQLIMKLLCCYI